MNGHAATVPAPRLLQRIDELGGEVAIEALDGDVSPRRYFRVRSDERTLVAAEYPPDQRPAFDAFLRTTELLTEAGVRVPRVVDADSEGSWMLLEDLGTRTLWDERRRPWSELEPLLRAARGIAARIAEIDPGLVAELHPPLDAAIFRRELAQTRRLFFAHPRFAASAGDLETLDDLLEGLCLALDQAPRRPAHRDFMARNLVLTGTGAAAIAVLDHQDLRLAPSVYDLASLLNDSLLAPPEVEDRVLPRIDLDTYRRAAGQRGLKIVGTFLAFAERGSARHLPLVVPSYRRALEQLSRVADGGEGAEFLRGHWRPRDAEDLIRSLCDGATTRSGETRP